MATNSTKKTPTAPPMAPRKGVVTRVRKGRWSRLNRRLHRGWRRVLELPALWIALLVAVGGWGLTPGGLLPVPAARQGEVATRDYVAPSDLLIPDQETTSEKQSRAREEVPPVYDYDSGAAATVQNRVDQLFGAGRALVQAASQAARGGRAAPRGQGRSTKGGAGSTRADGEQAGEDRLADELAQLERASGLKLTREEVAALSAQGFSQDLEERLSLLVGRVLRQGIVEGKARLLENRVRGITLRLLPSGTERRHYDLYDYLEYPGEVQEFLEAEVEDWRDLSSAQRKATIALLMANLPANLSPNRSETLERQAAAAAGVAPVFKQIRKGQVIVRKGDQIGSAEARMLAEITGRDRLTGRLLPLLGTMALLGLVALALWFGLRGERVADHSRARLYCEVLLVLLVSILGTKFSFLVSTALANSFDAAPFNSFRGYAYGVPFAGLALVASLLFGRTAAALAALFFALLVSRLAGFEALWVTLYAAVGSVGAVFAVDAFQIKQRLMLTRVGLVVGALNVVSVLVLTALGGGTGLDPLQLVFDLVCALVGGLLAAAVGSFSVPILESLLGITTDIKLVEIANANLPLLRRLAFEAPGTFQHSLMVANLAKEGCEVIGADPVLAYAGGLYHDVGKIFRPEYFVENQRPGHNLHDKLVPSMSALIIISHVKDGLALAEEYHLPPPVRDAIAQHHGTRLISFFFNRAQERARQRAKQRSEHPGDVTEEKYRYPGPKPQNEVMGVLMLADGVEAASRTLIEPTPLKIRTLVGKIFEDCLADGQLDESDLTLSDIKKVSQAFIRVLTTIFHQRIDYPGFDFRGDARDETRGDRTAEIAVRAS